ncbi:MAG: hypothetical protein JWO74_4159 [Solirubrobacterales bacterium]|nr:hypothetical protein [Solirubrobacterales bacterium]
MTLSERHIKAYDADTPPDPPAHKDRLSSHCSVGLTIVSPADSRLLLWPDASRARNNFNVSAALRASLPPEELPEVALRDIRPVEIDDQPGDVLLFPGSSVWHARRNGARAVNLYLKFNDFDSDPLGEDPRTPGRRADTIAALNDGPVTARIPVLSRRLDTVTRVYTRDREARSSGPPSGTSRRSRSRTANCCCCCARPTACAPSASSPASWRPRGSTTAPSRPAPAGWPSAGSTSTLRRRRRWPTTSR